jgi:tetratricopeptide (TPR) repeat protein
MKVNTGKPLGTLITSLWVLAFSIPYAEAEGAQDLAKAQQHADRGMQLAQAGNLEQAEVELRLAVALAPNDPLHLADLGGVLVMQQRLPEANFYFEKSLELDPHNRVIRRNLAANQWQLGDLGAAQRNLEFILKVSPKDKPTILLMGMVAENRKDYENAAKWLGSVPELVRQRSESLVALARSLYQTKRNLEAQEALQMLEVSPVNPNGVFLGGQVAAEANDYETAERLFVSIRSTYTDGVALGLNLAQVRYQAGRFAESQKTILDLIATGHETSDLYNLLGWCYQKQNQLKEAVMAFDQAIDLEPLKESNYLDLGMILTSSNLLPVALAVASKGLERIPESFRIYLMKGTIETRQGSYSDAAKSYGRALELNPQAPEANRGLAKAQSNAGMNTQALATFERGIKRFPQDALHYQEYALVLLKAADAGDATAESRALSLLETAIGLDNSLAESHYQLGNRALAKGQAKRALQYLERATKLDPQSAKVHYALARTYRRLGREDEALRELDIHEKLKVEEEKSSRDQLSAEEKHK